MNEERVPWSAELVETQLEARVFRVERYGRVGIMASYPWGWERRANGRLVQTGSGSNVDGMFRRRAAHYLTVGGLHEIPTERWVIVATDAPHGKDALECGPGGWDHGGCRARKAAGRFLVDILAEDGSVMGRIGVCAEDLARRLVEVHGHTGKPWDEAHELCGKTSGQWGSWVDWQTRLYELVAERVTAALEGGEHNPRPDVASALFAEARVIGDAVAAKAAKKAARATKQGGALVPLCTVRLPNGVLGRVMSIEGETAKVSVSSAVPMDAIVFAVADLERVDDIPRLYVTDDIVYVDGVGYKVAKRLGTDRVLVFERDESDEQMSFAVDEVTLAADMPPVGREELAKGWWRYTYGGRAFLSANLPDSLARGRLATLCNLTVDESGEMVGRSFGVGGSDSTFYWYAARPGVPAPGVTWWLDMKGEGTPLPPMTEGERAYMAAGPQERPAQRAEAKKTAKVPEGKKSMSAPKVKDISFMGTRGDERAMVLGQTYEVEELVGEYLVHHVGSGEEVCHYVKGRPAMKRAILADAVQRGQAQPGVVARVTPSVEVVETVPEQPVSEYGWERYGQRFVVGDVVRSGHPRAHLHVATGRTGVVVSVSERGDGEQMTSVRWGKNPVSYGTWAGNLVPVPVTVVERAGTSQLPVASPSEADVVDAELVDEEPEGQGRPQVVDLRGGREAKPLIQQVNGQCGSKADEGMWWANAGGGIIGRRNGDTGSMCETREDAEALAAWHLAGRVGPYPNDRHGAFAVLPSTVAVEWMTDFNEHEYRVTCAQCAHVDTVTGPLGHGSTAAKRRVEVRDRAIAAALDHAAQHDASADTDGGGKQSGPVVGEEHCEREWEQERDAHTAAVIEAEKAEFARTGRVPAAYGSLEEWLGEDGDETPEVAEHGGSCADTAEIPAQGPAGSEGQDFGPADAGGDSADPVVVFLASKNTTPPRLRVLWAVTRAEAQRICSDERSSGRRHMLCWTADPGTEGEDWEWIKDTGSYGALLAELGAVPARTWGQQEPELTLTKDAPEKGSTFSYRWTAEIGGDSGYSITGDCQGKVKNGAPGHKFYRVFWSHGEGDELNVWTLGKVATLDAAQDVVREHWRRSQSEDARMVAQRMRYASGEWLMPEVGDGEGIEYHVENFWTITSGEGHRYEVTKGGRKWLTYRGDDLHVDHIDGDGLVFVGKATEKYERRWPQMLGILREHSAALAARADTAEIPAEAAAGSGSQDSSAGSEGQDFGPADTGEEGAEADITISHTRRDGTLVEGTSRGDGSAEVLKEHRFRWSRNLECWYRPHSRDKRADTWRINKAAEGLRAAGFTVAVTTDEDTRRTFAEAEAERLDRAGDRAERFAGRASRAAASSDASYERSNQISERFHMGQPILIGHHSEGRARRDQERMHNAMRKSIEENRRAGYWADRARAAESYEQHRNDPGRTLRRIDKLEAERRGILRQRNGDPRNPWRKAPSKERRAELERLIEEIDEELAHWREIIAQAEADGFKVWSSADFSRGDFVRYRDTWYEVLRVNPKSLTVPHILNSTDGGTAGAVGGNPVVSKASAAGTRVATWTWKAPYNDVSGRMNVAQMRAVLAGEPIPAETAAETPVDTEENPAQGPAGSEGQDFPAGSEAEDSAPADTAEIPGAEAAGAAPRNFPVADNEQKKESTVKNSVVGRRLRQVRPAREKFAGARQKAATFVRETLPPTAARLRAAGQQVAKTVQARVHKPARPAVPLYVPVEPKTPVVHPDPAPVVARCDAHIARDGSHVDATEALTLGERSWGLCPEHTQRFGNLLEEKAVPLTLGGREWAVWSDHAEQFAALLVEVLGEPGDRATEDADNGDAPQEQGQECDVDGQEQDDQPGEKPSEAQPAEPEQPSVMLVGEVPGYSWEDARDALRNAGYRVVGRADESTVLIICGQRAERNAIKLRDARQYGIPCMDVTAPGRLRDAVRAGIFEGGDPLPEPVKAASSGMSERERNDLIREWGKRQGYELKDRGRLPLNVRKAYELAHQPEAVAA
ncbi:DUF3560 domain-containing protein [Streptomyces eurocidicus]|nr:DUF3560 domain-containing protein [Streptomyces eurocidicus]MBB5123216.1 hypothetical protein [Streptomyces eurocidicus]MBF6055829.1 DUF3560 domain-containing protein [Streptomyces eurocidicus]